MAVNNDPRHVVKELAEFKSFIRAEGEP